MGIVLFLHIVGGGLGLIFGTIAISAAKGGGTHRKIGMLFVYVMLMMSLSGALIAVLHGPETSVVMGLLTAYLVTTALTAVRPSSTRWVNLGLLILAMSLGVIFIGWGLDSLARGKMTRDSMPVPMLFVFGTIALLSGASDVHAMRSGRHGARRIARHLWRMCFALFIASASFFLGQAKVIPEPLRITPVLAILALAPLVVMLFWLWRVRLRKYWNGTAGLVRPSSEVKGMGHEISA